MEDGLAKGDLDVVLRIDPLTYTVQVCATQGETVASAEEKEIERLMKDFNDVFGARELPPPAARPEFQLGADWRQAFAAPRAVCDYGRRQEGADCNCG